MFGQNSGMPGDKMMKLFIIQAISSFVSQDYTSGLHYLNEVKSCYAENMSNLNPTLKILAKEIIQSLDMFAPGSSAESFMQMEEVANTPAQELTQHFNQQAQPEQNTQQPVQQPAKTNAEPSVTSDLKGLLERRKQRRKNR